MNTDDRDIVCEQDYTPLSNAELLTQIEQYTAIMYTSPIIDFDLEWITGPARALLARAEAAEAEARDARDARNDLDDAELHLRRAEAAATALVARVAELEAELAAQWRPVTEKPVADDEYLVWCSSYEGCEIQSYSSRLNRWYSNAGNDADYWRPLPPAPQEPTR